jgi:hypothetical protein
MAKNTQSKASHSDEGKPQSICCDDTKTKNEHSYLDHAKHFLTDENFTKLKQMQHEIYNQHEVSLPIRKLVNSLVTEENLDQLKLKLTEKFGI